MPAFTSIRKTLLGLIAGLGLILPTAALAGGTLTIQERAPFEKGLDVPAAVRAECNLETRVPDFVRQYAQDGYATVKLASDVGKGTAGQALSMKITGLTGLGGGAWSGPKHVTVEGTLWENGAVKGTFRAMRFSTGGAFGGFKGTCAILGRCVKAIGKDVGLWLGSPSMDARLGDAK